MNAQRVGSTIRGVEILGEFRYVHDLSEFRYVHDLHADVGFPRRVIIAFPQRQLLRVVADVTIGWIRRDGSSSSMCDVP